MNPTIAVLDKQSGKVALSTHDSQNPARVEDAAVVFNGRIYSLPLDASGTEVIAKRLQQEDRLKASEALLAEAEGHFSFVIAEHERIIAGRDPVGIQPLYYGENGTVAALASNKKALWKLGIAEALSFPPGNVVSVSREGFKFKPVKTLVYSQP